MKGFEQDAGLVLSVPKFQVLTGASDTSTVVARFGGILAGGLVTQTRSLGVDFTGGKARPSNAIRKGRLTKAKARLPFMRRLRAAGARTARLARAALAPAMLFGVGVTGLAPDMLLAARRIMRGAFRIRTHGKSLTLDLALEDRRFDPAVRAHVEPVLFFCVAAWEGWLDRGVLARTLQWAVGRAAGPRSLGLLLGALLGPWRPPSSALRGMLLTLSFG